MDGFQQMDEEGFCADKRLARYKLGVTVKNTKERRPFSTVENLCVYLKINAIDL